MEFKLGWVLRGGDPAAGPEQRWRRRWGQLRATLRLWGGAWASEHPPPWDPWPWRGWGWDWVGSEGTGSHDSAPPSQPPRGGSRGGSSWGRGGEGRHPGSRGRHGDARAGSRWSYSSDHHHHRCWLLVGSGSWNSMSHSSHSPDSGQRTDIQGSRPLLVKRARPHRPWTESSSWVERRLGVRGKENV